MGDSFDFSGAYDAEAGALRRYVRHLGVRDVDDVVHDTFLEALMSRSRFDASRSLRAWLYGIANHLVRAGRAKHGARFEVQLPGDAVDEQPLASETAEARERRLLLRAALNALGPEQREVFVWYYIEELPLPELARVSGTSENTLRSRLRLAVEKVESFFQGYVHDR